MNKKELVDAASEYSGLPKKGIAAALDALLCAAEKELVSGGEVVIVGFGKLIVKTAKGRDGHNPRTGEKLTIPSSKKVRFVAGKTLADAVKD
jgi:DNA-binding protein HU-beta